MAKKKKIAKSRLDKYYQLAKEQGYRSRAAYKLIQINKKFNFLGSSKCIIDLCSAPGGWLQVCSKFMPVSSLIIGADLVPIKPLHNCITLKADITSPTCLTELKHHLNHQQADTILNDGSPNVSGAQSKDSYSQIELALDALRLAINGRLLKKNGTFITKLFRSRDYNSYIQTCKQFFRDVTPFKPSASRSTSAEIFLVCQNFLAPKTFDKKLLDSAQVFRDADTQANPNSNPNSNNSNNIFDSSNIKKSKISCLSLQKVEKRNRQGYSDTVNMKMVKEESVRKFIECENPQEFLVLVHKLVFKKSEEEILKFEKTNEEIKLLCEDLQVLNKRDFKNLLKWRSAIRRKLCLDEIPSKQQALKTVDTEENKDETVDSNANVVDLIREREAKLLQKLSDAQKKEKRAQHVQKSRWDKGRRELSDQVEESCEQTDQISQNSELFSLSQIKSKEILEKICEVPANQKVDQAFEEILEGKSEDKTNQKVNVEDECVAFDENYLQNQEDIYDKMYERYKRRKGILDKKSKAHKQKNNLEDDGDDSSVLISDDDNDSASNNDNNSEKEEDQAKIAEFLEEEEEELDEEEIDLSDTNVQVETSEENLWFSNPVFKQLEERLESKDDVHDKHKNSLNKNDKQEDSFVPYRKASALSSNPKRLKSRQRRLEYDLSKTKSNENENEIEIENNNISTDDKKKSKTTNKNSSETNDFEIVPLEQKQEIELESDFSSDSDTHAEVLAIGKAMLSKKRRAEIIDSSYNRYSFDDSNLNLPEQFVDQERKHMRANLPVTKTEVNEFKEKLKKINARPIKKIAEALARKKFKRAKRLERLQVEANSIAQSREMSNKQKLDALERLNRRKQANKIDQSGRNRLKYVVAQKSGGFKASSGKGGGKIKMVDRRMKSDRRQRKQKKIVSKRKKHRQSFKSSKRNRKK